MHQKERRDDAQAIAWIMCVIILIGSLFILIGYIW